jgi:hypothetical protein
MDEYAYVPDFHGALRVIDVSAPGNPVAVGRCDTSAGARDVAVNGDHAYVIVDTGLRVIDVSDPSSPTQVGACGLPETPRRIAVNGNYAYVADLESGLRVVDVSTPTSPTEVGYYQTPSEAYDVAVGGNHAYVADWDTGLRVIDISTPTNPVEVGAHPVFLGFGTAEGVALMKGGAYVADGWLGGLSVFDVTTPSAPREIAYWDGLDSWSEPDVAAHGTTVYVTEGLFGLRVVDVSAPTSPVEVGYCGDLVSNAFLNYVTAVTVSEPYVYLATKWAGLWILQYTPAPEGTFWMFW